METMQIARRGSYCAYNRQSSAHCTSV